MLAGLNIVSWSVECEYQKLNNLHLPLRYIEI